MAMVSIRWLLLALLPFGSALTAPVAIHKSTLGADFALRACRIDPQENHYSGTRRRILSCAAVGVHVLGAAAFPAVEAAQAASSGDKELLNTLLNRLRVVPTFCLVNGEGIPYMIIKPQDRIAQGYAFMSLEGAILVLNDAQTVAQERGYFDIWKSATVVTLPADVALRLALKKRERVPTRGNSGTALDSIVSIIPTNEDREAAMMIDKRVFQDLGKVPLFYVEQGLTAGEDADGSMPLFFQKSALIQEWQRQRPGDAIPPIRAIDLTYLFEAALFGYVDKIPNKGNVSFVPDPEQTQIAQKMQREGLTMYKMDKMVV